jgi:hypothetical protein
MGDDIQVPEKPKERLAIKRGNVTIMATQRSPVIHTAVEQVTWQTGQVQINGIGANRQEALDALDVSYAKLAEVLAVAE